MEYGLDGYCGLYCGSCPHLLNAKAGIASNACFGCKSGQAAEWCRTCALKKCARDKGVAFCYECLEYPCPDLEGFKASAEYPYHREIYDYMDIIRNEGKDVWLEKMKVRWSCPGCGREASWWDMSCRRCGTALDGYVKP